MVTGVHCGYCIIVWDTGRNEALTPSALIGGPYRILKLSRFRFLREKCAQR
jgi:hypothetical protein